MKFLVLMTLALPSAAWEPISIEYQELKTVHSAGKTIDAYPYYSRINKGLDEEARRSSDVGVSASMLQADREAQRKAKGYVEDLRSGKALMPMRPKIMKPGTPREHVEAGVYQPFFIIGMDSASLEWMRANYARLAKIKATGIVAQADDWTQWQRLKGEANQRGVVLTMMPVDALAKAYGFTSYPVLVTGSSP